MDYSDSEDWDESEEEELNDEEYSNLEERIALLEKLENLTDEFIKTTSLFLMKCVETSNIIWIEKGDELGKIYHKEEKRLTDAYIALGGPDLSKGQMKIKLDYLAMVCGAMGSLMVSMPHDWQRVVGFCLFLSANLMWLKFCWKRPEWRAVLFLNLFYLVTSLIGIWNNFF